MNIATKISYSSPSPSVVALGCFDGVHLGHVSVISRAVEIARELKIPCIVFTFDEPPKNLFSAEPVPLITSETKKAELIASLGVDTLVTFPFTKEIAALTPSEFAEQILIKNLNAAHIVCGFNYTFGARAQGNTEFLADFCKERDIGLTAMPKLEICNECVSSSLIREHIARGEVENASNLLGRAYSLCAKVISDKGLARNLGFPTANQVFDEKTLMPKNAVYATRALIGGEWLPAITNVGMRPTVNGGVRCAETHIIGFSGDLYGKELDIEFVAFIRDEQKFESIEALTTRVLRDIETVKEMNI